VTEGTPRVAFLIHHLAAGGAERQLVELVKGMDRSRFSVAVVTFYGGGALGSELEGLESVKKISLERKGRWDLGTLLVRLPRVLRMWRPDVLYGFMEVPNLICLLAGRVTGAKVVWGIRRSRRDLTDYDWAERWSARLGAWLARFPDLVIVNSLAGKRDYQTRGYPSARMTVIPNGIDVARFFPDRAAGLRVRASWGVPESQPLIGLVGRIHPMKGHHVFLEAAARLVGEGKNARFAVVGDGPASNQDGLRSQSESLGLGGRVVWEPYRGDMNDVYNALDIHASCSSYGEGFSNAIAEAMACGIPCVATDVGDAGHIVGDAGFVVPTRDPPAMAAAWRRMLELGAEDRSRLGQVARKRICDTFSRSQMVSRTEAALDAVARRKAA
jgi:glycosyltransferase involved in cell wall biosynthesis